jgi:predicted dehydrogenase
MPKLRLIQAGVGGHGKSWVSATLTHPDIDLVAIADVNPAALAATEVPREKHFASLEEAMTKVQADAILTVTPPAVHIEHARLAFDRELHVMTEKPIADSVENAKLMVQLAKKANRQLVVTQNYRYMKGPRRLKKLIADRPLGEIGHGHIDFYIAGDFRGTFRQTMPYPLLIDMAIHHLDLLRSLTGRNIVRVMAHSFQPTWSWYTGDSGLKMFLELEGGVKFSYSGDWAAFGKQTPWGGSWRIQCDRGSIQWEGDNLSLGHGDYWGQNQRIEPVTIEDDVQTPQQLMLSEFAAAIREGRAAETSGEDNLWSFCAVMAGVKSAQEGRAVEVAELL